MGCSIGLLLPLNDGDASVNHRRPSADVTVPVFNASVVQPSQAMQFAEKEVDIKITTSTIKINSNKFNADVGVYVLVAFAVCVCCMCCCKNTCCKAVTTVVCVCVIAAPFLAIYLYGYEDTVKYICGEASART